MQMAAAATDVNTLPSVECGRTQIRPPSYRAHASRGDTRIRRTIASSPPRCFDFVRVCLRAHASMRTHARASMATPMPNAWPRVLLTSETP